MNLVLIILSILLLIINFNDAALKGCTNQFTRPILIVISLDGFRNDYFKIGVTPSLESFRLNGVYTEHLNTIFLPNALSTHHTIATGFYASKHGVVGHVTFSGRDKVDWYGYGEVLYNYDRNVIPIWLLNERNGGTSASMMWPGAEFPTGHEQRKPTYYVKYNVSVPMEERFKKVVSWLNRTRNQPNLIMVYINELDTIGHIKGPNDRTNLTAALKRIDSLRSYLRRKILTLGISHRVNIIYLSDHGMWPITSKNFKNLSTLHNCIDYYKFIGRHTYLEMGRLYEYRFNLKCEESIRRAYGDEVFLTRDDFKDRIEMNLNRLSNALLISKRGDSWGDNMWEKIEFYKQMYKMTITKDTEFGVHGYEFDNDAIFMAKGPLFVKYKIHPPFEMVDFFGLFARILLIKGNFSNHGNFSRVSGLLKKPREKNDWQKSFIIILLCSIGHCLIFYFAINFYLYHVPDQEEVDKRLLREDPELQRLMKER